VANWYEDESFWESVERFLFSCFRTDETTLAEADQARQIVIMETGRTAGG